MPDDFIYKTISKKAIGALVLSSGFIFFALINGDLGYMGIYFVQSGRISPFGALSFVALPPLSIVSKIYTLRLPKLFKKYRIILILSTSILWLTLVITGRRVFLYTLILTLLLMGPWIIRTFRAKKFKNVYLFTFIFITILTLAWGFRAFFTMRIAVRNAAFKTRPPITEILPYYLDILQDSYAMAEVQERFLENISYRPFVLSYLAGLLAAHEQKDTPLFGVLQNAIAMVVPSALYPQKMRVLANSAEEIVHPALGLPVFDGPNTILTAGLNDLGLFGILVYPLIIVVFYIILCRFIPRNWPPFLRVFIVIRLLYSILYIEQGLGTMIGSGLRDLLLVIIIYWVFFKINFKTYISNINGKII